MEMGVDLAKAEVIPLYSGKAIQVVLYIGPEGFFWCAAVQAVSD